MTDETTRGDIEVALRNGAEIAERALRPITTGHEFTDEADARPTGLFVSVLPDIEGSWAAKVEDLERFLEEPREKRGKRTFTAVKSFVDYLVRHRTAKSTVYASETGVLTSLLDDHGPHEVAGPGWGRHVAVLDRPETLAWRAWTQASGKAMSQEQFAEFLEDRAGDIASPAGAELIEIVQFFQASKSIAFRSARRLDNGQVQFAYDETLTGGSSTSGTTEVPTALAVHLARYRDEEPQRFNVRLRWRLSGDELTFRVLLDRDEIDQAAERALESIMSIVAEQAGVPVFRGSHE